MARRIEKVSPAGTTIYAYDGDNVVEELDGGGMALARYAQGLGIDEPLAMYRGGASYYYNADGLGSITSLTNASGQIAASYTYDSFGKLTASTGTVTNPFRYTGREYGTDTGLYYYRARYYDAGVGRFISEDPIKFMGGISFYTYVLNEPTGLVDPMGEYPCLNIQKFVDYMDRQAEGATSSTGNCAQAVKNGLHAGGLNVASLHNGPQNYGPGLERQGFVPISNVSPLRPGDVMIFQPIGSRTYGHIQAWNGSQWVSDYMQPNQADGYPGPGSYYERANPSYQLYRDPNTCP